MHPKYVFTLLALLQCTVAQAQEQPQDPPQDPLEALLKAPLKALLTVFDLETPRAALEDEDFRYLLGGSVQRSSEYWGSKNYGSGLKPVWALRWGKWHFSSSGGGALMGFGRKAIGPGAGASRDVFKSDSLRLGLGLRLDGGRGYTDEGVTAGLPAVRRSVRGRLYAAYAWMPGWNLSGALSQDLAGRAGGLIANIELSHSLYRSANAELVAGLGLVGGDSRYMRSYFGVPSSTANASNSIWQGRDYEPGAGLRELSFNLGYTYAFSPHWIGFASAGLSRLLGPAAASPITQQTLGHSAGLSLAYRN